MLFVAAPPRAPDARAKNPILPERIIRRYVEANAIDPPSPDLRTTGKGAIPAIPQLMTLRAHS